VEELEARLVLNTYTVIDASDTTLVTGVGTGNSGDLRYCINQANAHPGGDQIVFDIMPPGVSHEIDLGVQLPVITDPVTIDGYTELGASANTLTRGDDAHPLITLYGGGLPEGLNFAGDDSLVR
jgi:hypothetical protein